MESILPLLSSALIPIIQSILTKENVQLYGDRLFDLAEDVIKNSQTAWDDAALLPIIKQFRITLDIPDLPGRWPLKKILLQRRLLPGRGIFASSRKNSHGRGNFQFY